MDEYISREAVVRYLKGYSEKELNSSSFGMITSSVLNKAERAISEMPAADVQPVNHWISVKDRLPEIADNSYKSDVLLCYSMDGERLWFSTYEENGFGQRGFEVEKYYGVNVTHWMPLPQKPESEDDAE
jgi:hypothetical protein